MMDVKVVVDEVMHLYEQYGKEDYIGEPISQLEHMCQCAQLAEENGADEETIIAAFLHDIGHLCQLQFPNESLNYMDKFGIVDHEKLGGAFLRNNGFSESVAKMVENHVLAKDT
jgi:2-amino-1-hydroxyethylphosphonate dioxygenase (glycine-forming)